MAYLHWSNDLDTGIAVIDTQHRRIVDLINELNTANETGDPAVIKHVLNELVDYTLSHFTFEEELQLKANYPFSRRTNVCTRSSPSASANFSSARQAEKTWFPKYSRC